MIAPVGARLVQGGAALGCRGLPRAQVRAEGKGLATGLGDEGGFAPDLPGTRAALDLIVEAIEKTGYMLGRDIALALDVAATEFYTDGVYSYEGKKLSAESSSRSTRSWSTRYPLVSIEDPLAEDDWDGWVALTDAIGDKVQIVGDDLFVTNPERLDDGIARGAANALLVKVNQIGTLSETLDAVDARAVVGLPLHDEPPLGRDRGHHDRRPRGRHRLRADQDRRARPLRPRRQVQPAAADRGGARRRRALRRRPGLPAVHPG